MSAVEVRDLTVRYSDVLAVDAVSFTAEAGRITAVLGPNGAGKTSTIEVLEGFRRPTGGNVRVTGLDPITDHQALTERIGVMLQEGGVGPGVRAGEVLRHAAALYPHSLEPASLLERVGLTGKERRTWRQLSGGEQRRLALALALVGRPQVAFLDEPGSGVDPQGRLAIREVVAGLRDDGVTVVLTTHDLDEAERLADHVVILDRGAVVAAGTPDELMRAGAAAEVRFGAPPGLRVADLAAHVGAPVREDRPGEYVVAAAGTPALVAALTAWLAAEDLPLADLRAGRQRLEDVFLRLVGESGPLAEPPPAGRGRRRRGGRA
ncbi:MAG TPA: ABC transporter ATP-binding protein [Acidimicrobiales bacterium]|nr:ABC transporter ATP-binding protein [Acidimicrobiales bacterium]